MHGSVGSSSIPDSHGVQLWYLQQQPQVQVNTSRNQACVDVHTGNLTRGGCGSAWSATTNPKGMPQNAWVILEVPCMTLQMGVTYVIHRHHTLTAPLAISQAATNMVLQASSAADS